MFARLALVFLTLLTTSSALAQVYQWRDEQGKVHFTDTPPPESRNVTEQKLQVNTIQGLDDSQVQRTSSRKMFEDDEEELNPGQLHQKGTVQCAAAIRRMPSLIAETQKLGREAVRQKRATQAQLDDAMYKMDAAYKEMKRNEKACASDYVKGGEARLAVNCLADTDDVMTFGLCMKFGEWASTFGQ
ncbi:DUF4124 domain-containing protein [Pseudomonas solani]|uniref:DUF4124 domain-containing protein n=1 Tax=Pseudomonas solani TaxID=2731552 RepID=UPI003C2C4202